MARIHRLAPEVSNQIAAGEVVERPASIVKELIENALDAGATRIDVEIAEGGLAKIVVKDNGSGMDREDAVLCVERHATSKVTSFHDLEAIQTFGFRGEALPSIASVSHFRIVTRQSVDQEGTEVTVDGGGAPKVSPTGAAPGTTVTVDNLFFNVPARRKFLKSVVTEGAHVGDVVFAAALCRFDVTMTLTRDGRLVREYLKQSTQEERAKEVMGGEVLSAVRTERGPLRVAAFLGAPDRARAGTTALHLFINDRPVRDRTIARAVAHAYGSVLPQGKYPAGIVYLYLSPELVDVNVHPQKAEVRFQDSRGLFDALSRGLASELGGVFHLPALPHANGRDSFLNRPLDASTSSTKEYAVPASDLHVLQDTRPIHGEGSPTPSVPRIDEPSLFRTVKFYGGLKFKGQLRAMFLLCEGSDALYVIDQHAAHERVTFHDLRRSYAAKAMSTQKLLAPALVDVTESAAESFDTDAALALGMEVRRTGPHTLGVFSVPSLLYRSDPAHLLTDLLAELSHRGNRSFSDAVDLVLATMACHGSKRAGDSFTETEATNLLQMLDDVDFAGFCPHGRPIVSRIGFDELERKVGR